MREDAPSQFSVLLVLDWGVGSASFPNCRDDPSLIVIDLVSLDRIDGERFSAVPRRRNTPSRRRHGNGGNGAWLRWLGVRTGLAKVNCTEPDLHVKAKWLTSLKQFGIAWWRRALCPVKRHAFQEACPSRCKHENKLFEPLFHSDMCHIQNQCAKNQLFSCPAGQLHGNTSPSSLKSLSPTSHHSSRLLLPLCSRSALASSKRSCASEASGGTWCRSCACHSSWDRVHGSGGKIIANIVTSTTSKAH